MHLVCQCGYILEVASAARKMNRKWTVMNRRKIYFCQKAANRLTTACGWSESSTTVVNLALLMVDALIFCFTRLKSSWLLTRRMLSLVLSAIVNSTWRSAELDLKQWSKRPLKTYWYDIHNLRARKAEKKLGSSLELSKQHIPYNFTFKALIRIGTFIPLLALPMLTRACIFSIFYMINFLAKFRRFVIWLGRDFIGMIQYPVKETKHILLWRFHLKTWI